MKKEFEVEGKKFFVRNPTPRETNESHIYYAKACTKAIKDGLVFRDKLDKVMREAGSWGDEEEKRRKELEDVISKGVSVLAKGGIKKSEAKKIALETREARYELLDLLSERNRMDGITVEASAERERINYLISVCSKDEDGVNVFSSLDDYLDRADEPVAIKCAQVFAMLYAGWDEDIFKKLPENEFLLKYGYVDENLNLKTDTVEEKVEFVEFLDDDVQEVKSGE